MNMDERDVLAPKKEKEPVDVKKEIFQWVQSLVISVVIVALIFTFVGRIQRVDGSSMEPNFYDGERIVTTSIHGDYKYGDVVVIRRKNDLPLIKRIIALGGDTVNINFETGDVFVNDERIEESYIAEHTKTDLGLKFPFEIPENHVFVMGDNRNHSDDSRDPKIGAIDERNIFGKVVFKLYPFSEFGPVKFEG